MNVSNRMACLARMEDRRRRRENTRRRGIVICRVFAWVVLPAALWAFILCPVIAR